ncbi:MAG: hypothetical protein GX625_07535, partial [Clostridiaceae bacterium]|nr:hypothetical protein [Clostridiaceae bacterium]
AHDNQKKYDITVATSDNLQQIIIRGSGSAVISARELKEEIERTNEQVMQAFRQKQTVNRNYLGESLSKETISQIEELFNEEK